MKIYKKIVKKSFRLYCFDIPSLFIVEQLCRIRYIYVYLKVWIRVDKIFIIKKMIKHIIGIIKCNVQCYSKVCVLNIQIFFLKIKYYYYVFRIECIMIWWNYIEYPIRTIFSIWFWQHNLIDLLIGILDGIYNLIVQIKVAFNIEKNYILMDLWHIRYRTNQYIISYWKASKFTRTYAFARAEMREDENPNAPRPCTEDTDIETELTGKIWLQWLKDENLDVNWSVLWDKPLTKKEWEEFFKVGGENKKYFDGEGKIFFNAAQYKIYDANRPKNTPRPLSAVEKQKKKEEEKKQKIETFWKYIDRDIQDITNIFERTYGLCFILKLMRVNFKIMKVILKLIILILKLIKWIWSKIIFNIIYWIWSKIIFNLLKWIFFKLVKFAKWIWSKLVKFAIWLGTE